MFAATTAAINIRSESEGRSFHAKPSHKSSQQMDDLIKSANRVADRYEVRVLMECIAYFPRKMRQRFFPSVFQSELQAEHEQVSLNTTNQNISNNKKKRFCCF